jgi:hypothetical protein
MAFQCRSEVFNATDHGWRRSQIAVHRGDKSYGVEQICVPMPFRAVNDHWDLDLNGGGRQNETSTEAGRDRHAGGVQVFTGRHLPALRKPAPLSVRGSPAMGPRANQVDSISELQAQGADLPDSGKLRSYRRAPVCVRVVSL